MQARRLPLPDCECMQGCAYWRCRVELGRHKARAKNRTRAHASRSTCMYKGNALSYSPTEQKGEQTTRRYARATKQRMPRYPLHRPVFPIPEFKQRSHFNNVAEHKRRIIVLHHFLQFGSRKPFRVHHFNVLQLQIVA